MKMKTCPQYVNTNRSIWIVCFDKHEVLPHILDNFTATENVYHDKQGQIQIRYLEIYVTQ